MIALKDILNQITVSKSSPTTIGEILFYSNKLDKSEYPWAERFIGPYPVPAWQRPLCWTQEQSTQLIESILSGYDIGTYIVNDWEMTGDKKNLLSDICIDGQQRINAIVQYSQNRFRVHGRLYSELSVGDQRRFAKTIFSKAIYTSFDEQKLKSIYNRLNFSGTNHTESQRAI